MPTHSLYITDPQIQSLNAVHFFPEYYFLRKLVKDILIGNPSHQNTLWWGLNFFVYLAFHTLHVWDHHGSTLVRMLEGSKHFSLSYIPKSEFLYYAHLVSFRKEIKTNKIKLTKERNPDSLKSCRSKVG